MSSVTDEKWLSFTSPIWRMRSRSSLVRIGWRTSSRFSFEVPSRSENVRARADERHQAHDQLLADRVDRRVRHLGEVLLEVGVQQLGLRRQRRDRRVVAHGADRLPRPWRHGRHQELEAFLRVAERLLQIEQAGAVLDRRDFFAESGRSETMICVRFSHVS